MEGTESGREEAIAKAVTLFPEDTVIAALGIMQRWGVRQLAVVSSDRGELLGEVSEDELERLCRRMPLACMSEVLTAKAVDGEDPEDVDSEGNTWRPRVLLTSPLVDVWQASRRWKQ